MKLSNILYFDNEDGSFVAEKFYIDGNEVSEDGYEAMLVELDEANCIDEEEQCDCVNCTLDRFTEEIYELANGQICPGCVREILCDFLDEIVEHIVVEDISDGEGIDNKELLN